MNPWKRRSLILLSLIGTVYAGACLYVWSNQVRLTFRPLSYIPTTPSRMEMDYENVVIPIGSGTEKGTVHGFWVENEAADADAPVILYLHGNEATIGKNLEHTHRMHGFGYDVLLIDYRGFGQSFGTTDPSEEKVYEDAEAAWNYLREEKQIDPSRIVIYGHSLGGAIAIELASRHSEAAGLIAESTFTSCVDMARHKYFGVLRFLPVDSLLLHQRFESLEKMSLLELPVLLIHGDADKKIPWRMSQEIHDARPELSELVLIKNGEHANSGSIGLREYTEVVKSFVAKCRQGAGSRSEQEM